MSKRRRLQRLAPEDEKTVRAASRESVLHTFAGLAQRWSKNGPLPNGNWYVQSSTRKVCSDALSGSPRKPRAFDQYLSASGPLHCLDGWGLLGRAFHAYAIGDDSVASHLGYYAELRAAMSILGSHGIGVFDRKHTVTDKSRKTSFVPSKRKAVMGTHDFAWRGLRAWSETKSAAELLLGYLDPGPAPIGEWVTAFGGTGQLMPYGEEWLQLWGADIRRASGDQDARNEASYRPTRARTSPRKSPAERVEYLRSAWSLMEPSEAGAFPELDRHLLTLSLAAEFVRATGRAPASDRAGFDSRLRSCVEALIEGTELRSRWIRILSDGVVHQPPQVIELARRTPPPGTLAGPDEILSRALLLLRIATAASASLRQEGVRVSTEAMAWWAGVGASTGICSASSLTTEFYDLWADIESSSASLSSMKASIEMRAVLREHLESIATLSECERVALWALGTRLS